MAWSLPHALAGTQTTADAVPNARLGPSLQAVLIQMGHDPVALDVLQTRTGLDMAALQSALLNLELEGSLGRLPGGRVQRLARR